MCAAGPAVARLRLAVGAWAADVDACELEGGHEYTVAVPHEPQSKPPPRGVDIVYIPSGHSAGLSSSRLQIQNLKATLLATESDHLACPSG